MLARYLGSKQSMLKPLLATVSQLCDPGSHVVDAFSGSLAVSLGLKRAGYRVSSNDVNLFSSVLAEAYLLHADVPSADASVLPAAVRPALLGQAEFRVATLEGTDGWAFLEDKDQRSKYVQFVALQLHLQTVKESDLPPSERRSHFFDAYCEEGQHSAYVSSRGRSGRRRFLTGANGRRLDLILNQLRAWRTSSTLDKHTEALLLATVLRALEKVSNTQGTFHDFPREVWDPRALQPISLDPPALDEVLGGTGGHTAGREQDSLDYVGTTSPSDLLYLDPPYNFRQYTAYYFLPNVVCRYIEMKDPDEYFTGLTYVRGQNPADDFSSTFCKPSQFISDLNTLIQRSGTRRVLISYFNGRNHWSNFDSGPDDRGRQMLEAMLMGPSFEPGSLAATVVRRMNYASYGGYKARPVDELLLSAEVRQTDARESATIPDVGLQPVA